MNCRSILAAVVAAICLASSVAAAIAATGSSHSARMQAGAALGLVPSHNAKRQRAGSHLFLLQWYGGPVMHSTTVVPLFWGSSWTSSTFTGDKVTGLDYFYSHVGGSAYAHTNSEYYDGSGNVNTSSISKSTDLRDASATPSGAPSTSQVLAEVAKATNNKPIANAYYPVYSDQPRGGARYCAWHSSGTINGTRVQFGFFFN